MHRIKLMGADPTCDQINDWFKIGTDVRVATLPQSKLGGFPLDPDTGEAAVVTYRPVQQGYKRNVSKEDSLAYAEEYLRQERNSVVRESMPTSASFRNADDDGLTSLTSGLENVHDTLSTVTNVRVRHDIVLPDGMSEQDAVRIYENYNFGHKYDPKLPITRYRQDIIDMVESHSVTVIQGETGSGKTTQVAQFILDTYALQRRYCNIVVTQPRRIAAVSIARRVCAERGWQLGRMCGYQIGMSAESSEDTRLLFCTTGVLLQKLIKDKNMHRYTHVILDEVHERDQDSDFCLLLVRKLLWSNSHDVKVVLMSATIDSDLFRDYFARPVGGMLEKAPVMEVLGQAFNVAEFYVEDLGKLGPLPMHDADAPALAPEAIDLAVRLIESFDRIEQAEENPSGMRGSVLVFLPGLGEINDVDSKLRSLTISHNLVIRPLHSSITNEEQVKVFDQPAPGYRKVILSTNIAESSITVTDVRYVIDFCLTKVNVCDPDTNYSSLQLQWASMANCQQRKGRAGRVAQGRVYRLVTHSFYHQYLPKYGIPEMQRSPLEQLVLYVKKMDIGEPKAMLALALDPPRLNDIERTIIMLKEVGALASLQSGEVNPHDGELTPLGMVLSSLPVDIRLGKLMVLGHAFGFLDETIIISACQSLKSFFARPFKASLESYRFKLGWANSSYSDSISYLFAYRAWQAKRNNGMFRSAADEMSWGRKNFIQIRRIKEVAELVTDLQKRLREHHITTPAGPNCRRPNILDPEEQLILKIVLCGAFYPNYFEQVPGDDVAADREMSGYNPFTTVMVKGLPQNQGALYRQDLEELFVRRCGCGRPRIHFEETRAFVEFFRNHTDKATTKVLPDVYLALKLRQLSIPLELQMIDPDAARIQLSQMSMEHDRSTSVLKTLRSNRISDNGEVGSTSVVGNAPLYPLDSSFFPIKITEVVDCGRFWAHNANRVAIQPLLNLHVELQTYVRQLTGVQRKTDFNLGDYCLSPFNDGTSIDYYRARVEKVSDNRTFVEVFYLDYGNKLELPVSSLYELPDQFMRLPFQAFECELCKIKPSVIKCPGGSWTEEARARFQYFANSAESHFVQIYSVVHNVLRVQLTSKLGGVEKVVNRELIRLNYADEAEESELSMQSHLQCEQNIGKTNTARPPTQDSQVAPRANVLDAGSRSRPQSEVGHRLSNKIVLKGPWSSYEVNFVSCTFVGKLRPAKIERDSVNSIALIDEPCTKRPESLLSGMTSSRMLIASSVTLNPYGNSLTARDTTLMPSITGLLGLVTLIFAPTAELRADPAKTRYIGALCGLGWDVTSRECDAALADHDIELTFDFNFDLSDLKLINSIREAVNLAASNRFGEDAVAKIQQHARRNLLSLLQVRREPVAPIPFVNPYRWCQIERADICLPKTDNIEDHAKLYQMHCGIMLRAPPPVTVSAAHSIASVPASVRAAVATVRSAGAGTAADMSHEEKLNHQKWLKAKASRSTEREEILCRLCSTTLHSPSDLLIHLSSRMHRENQPV